MPRYDYICQVCGRSGHAWRPEGQPPKYCSKECQYQGRIGKPVSVKWPITPEIHEQIVRVYKRDTGNGQVMALARKIGYPRWKISRHATSQGLIARQKKEPHWSEEEVAILERNAHHPPAYIQKKLKAHGYHRTETGIHIKRKHMRFLRNLNGQSASSLAECLGMDAHKILSAINRGQLKATRRQTKPGRGVYYITDKHARNYIIENLNEIDIRKVDKYWFVDLLANQSD